LILFLKVSAGVDRGRDLVLVWRRCDVLCTSGFVDDVMFSHRHRTAKRPVPDMDMCVRARLSLLINSPSIPIITILFCNSPLLWPLDAGEGLIWTPLAYCDANVHVFSGQKRFQFISLTRTACSQSVARKASALHG